MRARVRWPILLLSLCLSGCKFEFTEIPRDTPALLSVALRLEDQTDQLLLHAHLDPGRDAETRGRGVTSDLVVLGQPLPPYQVSPQGGRSYRAEWSLSSQLPEPAPLPIRAPEVAGIGTVPLPYEAHLPRRLGPAALQAVAGEPLVLPLRGGASAVENALWRLDAIDDSGRTLLQIQSEGLPPAQIVVPASWLPSPLPSRVGIRVLVLQSVRSELVEGQYSLALTIQAHLAWTVSWGGPNETRGLYMDAGGT